jgi:predicted membrane protein
MNDLMTEFKNADISMYIAAAGAFILALFILRKLLTFLLIIFAVCLLLVGGYVYQNYEELKKDPKVSSMVEKIEEKIREKIKLS